MSENWEPSAQPEPINIGVLGGLCGILRGLPLIILVFGGLIALLLMRLVERPIFGLHRPVTPYITQFVCRMAFVILGIRFETQGRIMAHRGAVVANHSSWLDIFALNAKKRIYFVSKSEVAGWPAIGWLARATGTVFINRNRKYAKSQQKEFETRLLAGHKLLFFPEGTSTDGLRVLPFKSTLFQAFFSDELIDSMYIQPVTAQYFAPPNGDLRFYGWWGDMDFAPHLLKTLTACRQGRVRIIYHPPVKVSDFANRKLLAAHVETVVRGGTVFNRDLNPA